MGVYGVDEIQDGGTLVERSDGSYGSAPPRPTRADYQEPERQIDEDIEHGMDEDRDYQAWSHYGERVLNTDAVDEFTDTVVSLFAGAADRHQVDTLIENNKTQTGVIPDEYRQQIDAAVSAAMMRTTPQTKRGAI